MTTHEQITALRRAVAGVRTARPGVARQHMVTAMLAKATPLRTERDRLTGYLERGWQFFQTRPEECETFDRWLAALGTYQRVSDVLDEAARAIEIRRTAA